MVKPKTIRCHVFLPVRHRLLNEYFKVSLHKFLKSFQLRFEIRVLTITVVRVLDHQDTFYADDSAFIFLAEEDLTAIYFSLINGAIINHALLSATLGRIFLCEPVAPLTFDLLLCVLKYLAKAWIVLASRLTARWCLILYSVGYCGRYFAVVVS